MNEIDLNKIARMESSAPLTLVPRDPFSLDVRDLIPREEDSYGFKVQSSMHIAKARLKSFLKNNPQASNLSLDDLCKICLTQRLRVWIDKYPKFLIWFIDIEYETVRMDAYKENAIDVVMKIMNSKYAEGVLTAKDKLKAAEMMLQITNTFPQKTKETKYQDKQLESMDSDTVKTELKKAREQILTIKEKG